MYLRCPSCKQSFRIGGADEDRTAVCISCGRALSLMRRGRLGLTCEERATRAQRYAQAQSIDLASSYSVLLGIMPLPQAKAIAAEKSSFQPEAAGVDPELPKEDRPEADRTGGRINYDPGFHKAVASGKLTIRQAMERGDRVIYASRIAQEHGLTLNEAFQVADNRTSVAQALATRGKQSGEAILEVAAAASRNGLGLWLGLGVMMVLCIWGVSQLVRDEGFDVGESKERAVVQRAGPAPAITTATEVRVNPAGELTLVRGLDPAAALDAYCRAVHGVVRNPVRVVSDQNGAKIGIFRQGSDSYSVSIRQDRGAGGWVIGNGLEPIVPSLGTKGASSG